MALYIDCGSAECRLWKVLFMLSVANQPFMLSVAMLNVIVPSVVMLNVVMLNVVAPYKMPFQLFHNLTVIKV